MRIAKVERRTRETSVSVEVELDGSGTSQVSTGLGFLDHLLTILATHSLIDIRVSAKGDLAHHVVEDVAICLGEGLNRALSDRTNIMRFGHASAPMDDALAHASVDLVRRPYCVVALKVEGERIEDMAREDIYHLFRSLTLSIPATAHLRVEYGENDHHRVEAAAKALALALRQAASRDERRAGIPSSKGVI